MQYAHARCASIFRQAAEQFPGVDFGPKALAAADLSVLSDEAEIDMMRRIASFPRTLEQASSSHEPHRVAFYLYDLAASLHQLWNKGKDLPQLRFVNHADGESTRARLALAYAVRCVVASGLSILGVAAPDEMR